MAVTHDKPTPYATATSIISIITKYRSRGLTTPFNSGVLARAGVSKSLIARTLQAIQILDLVDEDGNPTETLEGIRLAAESDYKSRLAEWLKAAYSEVFSFVDPSTDDETAVRDAFRSYKPVAQQERMVSLFLNLCVEAGIKEPSQKESKPRLHKEAPQIRAKTRKKTRRSSTDSHIQPQQSRLPVALAGLMNDLPSDGEGWTQEKRDKFVTAFQVMLDYSFPIREESATETEEEPL
jgi:hypothetical protein